MALNVDYVVRETGINIRRNLTLTIAALLTVVVSLTLVGITLLVRQGVNNASGRFRGDIELIVFLEPKSTEAQRAAVKASLEKNPEVKDSTYVNQEQALKEFKELFKDEPETTASVTADILPPSFRVTPVNADYGAVVALKSIYSKQPGVREVVSADETIKAIQKITGKMSTGMFFAAVVLLSAALLLIFNTIRTAMFARRREIEVMKLVGATNWFIRIPFILEGLFQGILGGALAAGLLAIYNNFLTTQLAGEGGVRFLENFVVPSHDVLTTGGLVLILGALVGAIGSALAVGPYLDV